ncbi:putative NRPS-like protein biosynthetic cluster [Arachnomyces sp. PD_36]|nr:putative NRPS-like protein biosynthetic cluster [Arachnomyces sp. PD_36]
MLDNPQTILDAVLEEPGIHIDHLEDVYPSTHMQQGLIALTEQDPPAYIGSYTWQVVQIPDGLFQVIMKTNTPWKTVTDTIDEKELTEIDINHGPLVRFYSSEKSLRLDIHHALFDEWSLDLIMVQVGRAYAGEALRIQPFSPPVQHLLHHQCDATMEDFWRQEFSHLKAEHFPASASRSTNVRPTTEKVVLEHGLQLNTGIPAKYTLSSIVRLAWAIIL